MSDKEVNILREKKAKILTKNCLKKKKEVTIAKKGYREKMLVFVLDKKLKTLRYKSKIIRKGQGFYSWKKSQDYQNFFFFFSEKKSKIFRQSQNYEKKIAIKSL